jgi:hypothetical protein
MNFSEFLILNSQSHTNCSRNSPFFGLASGEFNQRLNTLSFLLSITKFALHAESIRFLKDDIAESFIRNQR